MNLLNKTAPWVVATLLAATSAFGQDKCRQEKAPACPPPCNFKEMTAGMPGYNSPSRINVCGSWDFYASGTFLYWQTTADNITPALTNNTSIAESANGMTGDFVQMNFDYLPGFKVALGMNFDHDNWDSYAEYTRVHGKSTTSSNGPAGGFLIATWGNPQLVAQSTIFQSVSSSYTSNFDFVDWMLGRDYFVGTNLTFHTVVGARGAWILEKYNTHYRNSTLTGTAGPNDDITALVSSLDVKSRAHSWAVGPRVGMESKWLLGQGIRLFGNGYADLLYTKYHLNDKSVLVTTATGASVPNITSSSIGVVRTHLDLEMGFGWGSYFDNNNWHVDLSASYGFQVFFDQSMLRQYASSNLPGFSQAPSGNMYVQGLNITARLDF